MIVITTPTGDIGRQVLDRILDSGEAVRVIARDPSRLPERVHARADVVPGSHGDADTITKALAGADRLFWLVPPPPFSYPGRAEQYYLDFTRPACEAIGGLDVRVVGVTTLGHGYPGQAGMLSAALAMDELIEGTGAAYRALALPFFMENLLRQAQAIKERARSPWPTPRTGRCRPSPPATPPRPPPRSCSTPRGAARPASRWSARTI